MRPTAAQRHRVTLSSLLGLALAAWLATAAGAEEGMWLLNDPLPPLFAELLGTPLSAAELAHIQGAAVRVGFGGSGSFVSPEGLVLTNHHVARDCIQKLSSAERNLSRDGFVAARREDELRCPDTDVQNLLAIEPVSERVVAATAGVSDEAEVARRRRAEIATIERECAQPPAIRCEVVTLFGGARFDLYRYRRYTDVRLVMAPEADLASFGGDPDNFDYPRFCLDFSLLRVYDEGRPVQPEHWLRWAAQDPAEGEALLIAGHPGSTRRNSTVAQLQFFRDELLPAQQAWRDQLRAQLEAYAGRGPEQARQVASLIASVTNSIKANAGAESGLLDPALLTTVAAREDGMRAALAARPDLKARLGDPWADLEASTGVHRSLGFPYRLFEAEIGFPSRALPIARTLVRLADEAARPDGERLPAYREAARPVLERRLYSAAPLYPELEEFLLANYLWRLRSQLGPIHPLVLATMGRTPPEALARDWIARTKLFDVEARRQLAAGGRQAIAASDDPLIRFLAALEPLAYDLVQRYDTAVDAVEVSAGSRIERLRHELATAPTYPDATSSLRITVGRTAGYQEAGQAVPWATDFRGLLARAHEHGNQEPWDVTERLLAARPRLELAGPVNFVSTHDTTGGNSGSPVINRKLEVVGVLFDGNLYTLPNRYLFSDLQSRSLSVHASAILQALRTIYPAPHLVTELLGQ